MADDRSSLTCWRCAASLAHLSLPLSRMDNCAHCGIDVHVCRQCVSYDRAAPRQCRNDDAEDVKEKERPNFCDWFRPGHNAWQGQGAAAQRGPDDLDRLFGAADDERDNTVPDNPLDDLFRN